MFESLFGTKRRRESIRGTDSFAEDRQAYADQRRRMANDFSERRAAILKAGGATLDHRPGYADSWEAAIQRLLQEGELREQIDFATFPKARSYHYTLTPNGQREAAKLQVDAHPGSLAQPASPTEG